MAFGIQPSHSITHPIDGITPQQFYILAVDAAKFLGWNVSYLSESGFKASTGFSGVTRFEFVTLKVEGKIAFIQSQTGGSQMTDWGRNKKNLDRLLAKIEELNASALPENLSEKYEELKQQFVPKEVDTLVQWHPSNDAQPNGFFALFKPRDGFYITPLIIELNVIVFIVMVISGVSIFLPDNESLIQWGANFQPITLSGEWWRLLTCMFLHIGIVHLLLNMYALLYIGVLLEPYLGKFRFGAAYLLTGIASSVASLWWNTNIISAGASGAIFGMYGVFLAMLTTNIIDKTSRKPLLSSIAIFVGYNLINGMKGGIDNAAHIGGLISGLIIGYSFYPSLKKSEDKSLEYKSIALLAVLVIGIASAVYKSIPNDMVQYDDKIKTFSANEKEALQVYKMIDTAPKDSLRNAIVSGLKLWKDNLIIVTGFKDLKLPENLLLMGDVLARYCNLRISTYQFLLQWQSNPEDTFALQNLKACNHQIQIISDSLSSKDK